MKATKKPTAIDRLTSDWSKALAALTPELIALAPSMSAEAIELHARNVGLNSLYDLRNSIKANNALIAALS